MTAAHHAAHLSTPSMQPDLPEVSVRHNVTFSAPVASTARRTEPVLLVETFSAGQVRLFLTLAYVILLSAACVSPFELDWRQDNITLVGPEVVSFNHSSSSFESVTNQTTGVNSTRWKSPSLPFTPLQLYMALRLELVKEHLDELASGDGVQLQLNVSVATRASGGQGKHHDTITRVPPKILQFHCYFTQLHTRVLLTGTFQIAPGCGRDIPRTQGHAALPVTHRRSGRGRDDSAALGRLR